tara:strand:- start:587 stop:1099 length:513 start_codon:yes stop_codon:yes gene_type:complete
MILTCNSCDKKFVVPDSAITSSGRMVQCGSCGNKWKQFPINEVSKSVANKNPRPVKQKIQTIKKPKRNLAKKPREINLYSPEYLAKKHGIKISEPKTQKTPHKNKKDKVSFGFYNSLILFIFFAVSLSRILYFAQEFIVKKIPTSEFYLNYFFESIRNIFEIWKNLITIY